VWWGRLSWPRPRTFGGFCPTYLVCLALLHVQLDLADHVAETSDISCQSRDVGRRRLLRLLRCHPYLEKGNKRDTLLL